MKTEHCQILMLKMAHSSFSKEPFDKKGPVAPSRLKAELVIYSLSIKVTLCCYIWNSWPIQNQASDVCNSDVLMIDYNQVS